MTAPSPCPPVGGPTVPAPRRPPAVEQRRPRLAVRLLGSLSVLHDGTPGRPVDLGGSRCRALLARLLLARGGVVSKEALLDQMWPQGPTPAATTTLESYVSVLRKRLEPAVPARSGVIRTTPGGYAIDPSRVDCDLYRYEELVEAARTAPPSQRLGLLDRALRLGSRPLLDGDPAGDDPWLADERERHARHVRGARLAHAEAARARGRHDLATADARALLAVDPFDEAAWLALLSGLREAGHPAQALREYQRCREVFASELGCAPGPALRESYHQALRDGAGSGSLEELLEAVVLLHSVATGGPASRRPAVEGGDVVAGAVRGLRALLDRVTVAPAADTLVVVPAPNGCATG